MHGISIWSLQVVKLVFSFCAKFKDIACIVNHHYHVSHVQRQFYIVNKSCSIVCQLHMIPDYVSIIYIEWPVDTASGKINWYQTWLGKYTRSTILTACIVYTAIDFWYLHKQYTGKIFGSYAETTLWWSPHYYGVAVYM